MELDYKTAIKRLSKSECPVCGNSGVEYKNLEILSDSAVQTASCTDCDSKWEEYYSLTGVEIYETGVKDFDFSIKNNLTSIQNIPEILLTILEQKEILPTLLGIDENLDKLISEKLKK